jgi:ubiquinone/menaquinone biosynthesis C-methylase UbiE
MNYKDTFNPSAFERLKKAEENHFWFQIRRKWIFDRIMKFIFPPAKILEVGCGTGNVSSFLAQKGYIVTGCELYSEAINMSWPGFLKVQGDANNLPFKDTSFDIVGLFDMIEHFQDDTTPLKEAIRVLKKGGIIVVTVPAREELWSYRDERALHKRRYTKERLKIAFSKANIKPVLTEYMFMSLYMPMKYLRGKSKKNNNQFKINKLVNPLLKGIFNIERLISKGLPLPIGTSLIVVAQKNI